MLEYLAWLGLICLTILAVLFVGIVVYAFKKVVEETTKPKDNDGR